MRGVVEGESPHLRQLQSKEGRVMTFHVPEKYRIKSGLLATDKSIGNSGAFSVKSLKFTRPILCIASDGAVPGQSQAWEHVSISVQGANRCPTWDEMAFIKRLFWDAEDTVIQFHPPESQYVNLHPYTLHLWRPVGVVLPLPDPRMVG